MDLKDRIVASAKLLGTEYDSQDERSDDKIREAESGFEHTEGREDEQENELSLDGWHRHVRVDSSYGVFYTSNRAN